MSEKKSVPVTRLSQEEALDKLKTTTVEAQGAGDLSIVLGSNGRRGRLATGNYSLIAQAIGCGRQQIAKVLRGKTQSLSLLREISRATDLTVDEILLFIDSRKE